jgi:intraflagellar transport protein 140
MVEKFVEARRAVKRSPGEMINLCNQLLEQPDVESAIRVGDVYALLIEYYHGQRNFQQAYNLIERMRSSNIVLSPYLDSNMVRAVHEAVGAVHEVEEAGEAQEEEEVEEETEQHNRRRY